MLEGKMTRLLDALLSKTRSKTINWQETPAQNKYLATVGKGSVTIQMVSYASALPDYVLAILDEYGQEIESDTKSSPSEDRYDEAKELYEMARRQAHNVEGKLDAILADLEG